MTVSSSIQIVDGLGVPREIGVLPAQIGGRTPVQPLASLGAARQLAASASPNAVSLTSTSVSVYARGAAMRIAVGSSPTASRTTSHYIAAGERIDFTVTTGWQISVVTDSLETSTGSLEITEFAYPT